MQYIDLVRDMQTNAGLELTDRLNSPDVLIDRSDGQDDVTKTAVNQEYSIDLSGGTEDATYFVSGGYKSFDEVDKLNETDQFFTNLKGTFKIKDRIRIGINALLRFQKQTGNGASGPGECGEMAYLFSYFGRFKSMGICGTLVERTI